MKGIVTISGHGSGESLYGHPSIAPALREIARELHLAIFKFVGNPMQRGFWPKSLLYERLKAFGEKSQHPELEYAPLFLYGHSNGTGFSAIFPATEGQRVWAWVSMRPGITFQVYQPGAAQVPGLVIFGEDLAAGVLLPLPHIRCPCVCRRRSATGSRDTQLAFSRKRLPRTELGCRPRRLSRLAHCAVRSPAGELNRIWQMGRGCGPTRQPYTATIARSDYERG